MNITQNKIISDFVMLGQKLKTFGQDKDSCVAIDEALRQNMWFTQEDVIYAVEALREQMLDEEKLLKWAEAYELSGCKDATVGIVMAGNLPLVGFADLLYVLVAGYGVRVKYSSKDEALMSYVVGLLMQIDPLLSIEPLAEDESLVAVIATGSDNSNRYFKTRFSGIVSLLRQSRYSVAVLHKGLSEKQLKALADDIFLHSGLGCRNVSHLLVERGYDVSALVEVLSQQARDVNPHYKNNYLQNKALCSMTNKKFTDGGFFTLSKGDPKENLYLSNISYSEYGSLEEVRQWLEERVDELQCVVTDCESLSPLATDFGTAQTPTLSQYADNKDVMSFLLKEL